MLGPQPLLPRAARPPAAGVSLRQRLPLPRQSICRRLSLSAAAR